MHLRERFPILENRTYLASHSLGAVPHSTQQSLEQYYREWATQGILAWDGPWYEMISVFGNKVAQILHAPENSIVPMENVTRTFAAIASSLNWKTKRNKIVMTNLEFLTSFPFWQNWAEMIGARLVIVESDDGISIDPQKICDAIDEETLLVPTSHVYFRSGAIQDLAVIVEKAHQVGAYVCGDGYQSAGIVPIHLQKMKIDFFVGGSHKWFCGGPGAGYLYVRPDLIDKLSPKFSGWFGVKDPFAYKATTKFPVADGIMRFMAGTPSMPALYAAIEGIRTVAEVGMEKIRSHSIHLTQEIVRQADERKIKVRSPRDPQKRSGMVCIDFEGAQEATEKLIQKKVIVDYRPNCGIRVSPHFYNGLEDLEVFWSTLDSIRK